MGSIPIPPEAHYGLPIVMEAESQDFELPSIPDVTITRIITTITVDVGIGMPDIQLTFVALFLNLDGSPEGPIPQALFDSEQEEGGDGDVDQSGGDQGGDAPDSIA
ncbi:SCP domain-containing protein [Psidium guajava]|nr:SCP domain-containing protein [Psidium guajava]